MPTEDAPKPAAKAWLRRDDRRALLLCVLVASSFLGAMGAIFRDNLPAPTRTALAIHNGDDLTTGSIVFVPILGDRCRRRLIDNATWRIRDNGFVDCRTALAQSGAIARLRWSTARVDVIRHGFAKR